MIEITKESIDCANYVDKQEKNTRKTGIIGKLIKENKALLYMLGAFFIFSIANLTLIYNFFKILQKL